MNVVYVRRTSGLYPGIVDSVWTGAMRGVQQSNMPKLCPVIGIYRENIVPGCGRKHDIMRNASNYYARVIQKLRRDLKIASRAAG